MTNIANRPAFAPIRFSPAQAQRSFRVLLDALARPGVVHRLDPADIEGIPAVFAPVLCLADLEVSLGVIDADGLSAEPPYGDAQLAALVRRTGARPVGAVAEADMILAIRAPFPEMIAEVRRGDAFSPELGARLFVGCTRLSTPADRRAAAPQRATRIWLIGPGATNGRAVDVEGIGPALFEQLAAANASPPAGIDAWLVGDDGAVIGIPRSSRLEVVAG